MVFRFKSARVTTCYSHVNVRMCMLTYEIEFNIISNKLDFKSITTHNPFNLQKYAVVTAVSTMTF